MRIGAAKKTSLAELVRQKPPRCVVCSSQYVQEINSARRDGVKCEDGRIERADDDTITKYLNMSGVKATNADVHRHFKNGHQRRGE